MGIDYRYGSQTVFKIQYHFVFVTKYRYQVLKVMLDWRSENWSGKHVMLLKWIF